MNIGIYNPYLDTLGGHERYCLDIATCFSDGHTVDIFWDDSSIIEKAEKRFHMNLRSVRVTPNIWRSTGLLDKLRESRNYDVLFFVSDGSVPLSLSRKTFLLFEFPVSWVNGKNFLTQIKIHRMFSIICNSSFVKQHIDTNFNVDSKVLFPGVDTSSFVVGKKEKLIISVGRYTKEKNIKKQEFLIDVFKKLSKKELNGWRLVLAGGALEKDVDFVKSLIGQSKGYPIEIHANIPFQKLQELYAKAQIYWHAAGFGEELNINPERAEHFGISTVEAMSAGAVPVVFSGGGQKEIVTDGFNGFLWDSRDDLIAKTLSVIADPANESNLSRAAQSRAKDFSRDAFRRNLMNLL